MFNLQTLTAKARELRGNVVKATTTKGTRTMTPVYEREEQRKLRERITLAMNWPAMIPGIREPNAISGNDIESMAEAVIFEAFALTDHGLRINN